MHILRKTEAVSQSLPRLALAMGDPAGTGPEVLLKALMDSEIYRVCVPIVIGDVRILAKSTLNPERRTEIVSITQVEDASPRPDLVTVLDLANVPNGFKMAEASADGGRASVEYLKRGAELALADRVEAVVSAPFNKEAMKKAGFPFVDEYEYLSSLCGSARYVVAVIGRHFTLTSVTLHVAMRAVASLLTRERVLFTIRYSDRAVRAAGVSHPRIGVAAFNPHAGEGGTLGTEELDIIGPAVKDARAEGIDAHGPFPADTFFMTVEKPVYDVYVGMYHDQGRIAMKLLDFGHAVTIAEGLPILFSTVGHGTAYDIAGKGIARHENMKEAILLAARRAIARRKEQL